VSAIAGAAVLVLADLIARTVASPAELPLGILTAGVGGPVMLWLLIGRRRVLLG
jgi:iron complex transport system permease protein